jgi:hypothetical protein
MWCQQVRHLEGGGREGGREGGEGRGGQSNTCKFSFIFSWWE